MSWKDFYLEEHRDEESFQDMRLMANRKKHSVTNTALYFAASNSRTITPSTSSGRGSGSFSTNPPLTALNSTLLPSRSNRAERTGRGIPASASTGWFQSST